MAKRHKPQPSEPDEPQVLPQDKTSSSPARLSRGKLWSFRLLAMFVVPLALAGLIELSLRLAGVGYPTTFLLSASSNGQDVFVQNNQFGWRFFGRDLARWPYPFSIAQSKATNTVRILVLGESAARGEPQPDFGLPRMLQAMAKQKAPTSLAGAL